jgi:maleamate amidohydrolase
VIVDSSAASSTPHSQGRRGAPHWKATPVLELQKASPQVEPDPRIVAAGPDMVPMKSAPSIVFATQAAAILIRERVDTVIVTVCITSRCVHTSVIDTFSLGFRVIVPQDCVGGHDQAAQQRPGE